MSAKALAIRKPPDLPDLLLQDLRELITRARQDVARTVNSSLVFLYWNVGRRIQRDILKEKRAGYGKEIMQTVSAKLVTEFGAGFTARNLFNMLRFAEVFTNIKIVHSLSAQLSWTHFRQIIYLKDELQKKLHEAITLARSRLIGDHNKSLQGG
jgi:hypothetical protein